MKKIKKLKRWEAAAGLLLIPTVLLMVILLFFVPPVLEQYDWVRPEDADKTVEALSLVIVDEKMAFAQYSVKRADGTLEQVESDTEKDGFGAEADPNGGEGGSVLTLEQAKTLVQPMWEFTASAGDWYMVNLGLMTPRVINMALGKIKVDATLSVSTGRLTVVEQTKVEETDLGILSVSAVDQDMTHSFHAQVLLIP